MLYRCAKDRMVRGDVHHEIMEAGRQYYGIWSSIVIALNRRRFLNVIFGLG